MSFSSNLLPKSMQSARRFIKLIGNQEVPNMMTIPINIRFVLLVLASSSNLLIADLTHKKIIKTRVGPWKRKNLVLIYKKCTHTHEQNYPHWNLRKLHDWLIGVFHKTRKNTLCLLNWFCLDFRIIIICCRPRIKIQKTSVFCLLIVNYPVLPIAILIWTIYVLLPLYSPYGISKL